MKVAITRNGRRIRGGLSCQARAWARISARTAPSENHAERPETDREHEAGIPVAALERAGRGLCGGSPEPELAGDLLQRVFAVLDPEREQRRDHETERHEPEEDAEGDASGDQPAAKVPLGLDDLADERRTRHRLDALARGRDPFGERLLARWRRGIHPAACLPTCPIPVNHGTAGRSRA